MFGNHGLCGLLEEGAHEKSPKCLGGNLGDLGEFCKGLILPIFFSNRDLKFYFTFVRTPFTFLQMQLKMLPAGKMCGAATYAVGRDAGYGLLFRTSMQLQTRQRIRLAVYRNRVFFQAALGSGFQLPLCPIGKVMPFEVFQPEFVV